MTSNPYETKHNLDVITPDTMPALLNHKNKYLQKTARMIDLLKLINYDKK